MADLVKKQHKATAASVKCNSYTMATKNLPDIYALAQGRAQAYIYQANPEWPW